MLINARDSALFNRTVTTTALLSSSFSFSYFFLHFQFFFTDNYAVLAAEMARANGYSDERLPFLQALIKSRNGRVDEAQQFIDDGK